MGCFRKSEAGRLEGSIFLEDEIEPYVLLDVVTWGLLGFNRMFFLWFVRFVVVGCNLHDELSDRGAGTDGGPCHSCHRKSCFGCRYESWYDGGVSLWSGVYGWVGGAFLTRPCTACFVPHVLVQLSSFAVFLGRVKVMVDRAFASIELCVIVHAYGFVVAWVWF